MWILLLVALARASHEIQYNEDSPELSDIIIPKVTRHVAPKVRPVFKKEVARPAPDSVPDYLLRPEYRAHGGTNWIREINKPFSWEK